MECLHQIYQKNSSGKHKELNNKFLHVLRFLKDFSQKKNHTCQNLFLPRFPQPRIPGSLVLHMTLYAKSFEYICFLEPPHISRTSCPDKPWQFRYLKRVHILQAVFQTLLAAIVFRTFLAVFRTILAAFRTLLAAFHTLLATFRALRTRNRDSSLHLFKPKFFLLHCQVHFLEFFQTGGF